MGELWRTKMPPARAEHRSIIVAVGPSPILTDVEWAFGRLASVRVSMLGDPGLI